ncbi:MAG: Tex family protein [Cytophagales bacterium]
MHIQIVAKELAVSNKQVEATLELLDEGATVPFISRYRKEATGSLDEVQVAHIRDRIAQLRELDKRRESILKSIREQGKLTESLEEQINAAQTLTELEDLYLPYKPKRKTRASMAKEKGLEPLATQIFEQAKFDVSSEADKFIDAEKGVNNTEEALAGARDIIAEWISEDKEARVKIRTLFLEKGAVSAKVIESKKEEAQKYKDYFEWSEPLKSAPSHRILALRRGEKEGFLMLDMLPEEEEAIALLENQFVKSNNQAAEQVKLATRDSYKRLLRPSIETEVRISSKDKADEEAIRVFADNARQLLMAPALGEKIVLALDPGFRTGCKAVILDKQGKLLENDTIYPHEPQRKTTEAAATIKYAVEKFKVEAIAIGNGTAGRETEEFVRNLKLPNVQIVMVNESGASIYSASEVAREEFPDKDVTVRGAVSIGRRLMDPLAELVKIDPKSIGVGQYQHDVDQTKLQHSLDDVVISSVNHVGVELNTASKQLLSYVSGLGPALAQNIIEYRNQNGAFKTRAELKKVARLGDKAYEQAAGFLRIRGAKNPLDCSAVHPESYKIVEQMAKDLSCTVEELMKNAELRKQIKPQKYVTETVGLPTLNDIINELAKPGRDPREAFEAFSFQDGVNHIEDLRIGMKLPGIVTNLTAFGAFVDIGVHQDGLVHVSQITDKFITNPSEVLKVAQKVMVTVTEVDISRKRISLTMKDGSGTKDKNTGGGAKKSKEQEPEGDLQAKLNKLKGLWK